jgi:iron(III) transport system substrate-binding protein
MSLTEMTLSRRSLLALSGASSVAAMLTMGQAIAQTASRQSLHQAARGEGPVTWYVAQYATELANAVARAYSSRYEGLQVNVVRTTATVGYQRLTQELRAGAPQCDVLSSTDVGHYIDLQKGNHLATYTPEAAAALLPQFRDIDPQKQFHVTSAGLIALVVNSNRMQGQTPPATWQDLTDPRWRGMVSTGHPGFSGYVAIWAALMQKLYGASYFERLNANRPQVGRSIQDTVTVVTSGERAVAAGPTNTAFDSGARGNPVKVLYPTDGTVLISAPSAVLRNARNPNAARLFLDFLMSVDVSRLVVQEWGETLHDGVATREGQAQLSAIKTISLSNDEQLALLPAVREKWRDIFGA